MSLLCARPHMDYSSGRGPRDYLCESFGAWVEHWVLCHSPLWLKEWLVDTGFLDAEPHEPWEYAPLFWRWDWWNATLAARYRELGQKQWEARRALTRAKWGETAG